MDRTLSNVTIEKIRQLKLKLRRFESQPTLETPEAQVELGPMQDPTTLGAGLSTWTNELEAELEEELATLVKNDMAEDEVLEVRSALLKLIKDLTIQLLHGASSEMEKKIAELEAQLHLETELRSLTEMYQAELESHLEALRNMNVQPMKKPKKWNHSKSSSKEGIDEDYDLKVTQLETQTEYLKKELATLQEKYSCMVNNRAVLFFEKEHLKLELESLTQDLFEEANKMVANESRLRAELQSSNQQLSRELQMALDGMLVSANVQKEKYYMVKKKKSDGVIAIPMQMSSPDPDHPSAFSSKSPDYMMAARSPPLLDPREFSSLTSPRLPFQRRPQGKFRPRNLSSSW